MNGLESELADPDGGVNVEHKHREIMLVDLAVLNWTSLYPYPMKAGLSYQMFAFHIFTNISWRSHLQQG